MKYQIWIGFRVAPEWTSNILRIKEGWPDQEEASRQLERRIKVLLIPRKVIAVTISLESSLLRGNLNFMLPIVE